MEKIRALELTGTITALANAIASNLSIDETAFVASVLVQLGDTLATIITVKTLYEDFENQK